MLILSADDRGDSDRVTTAILEAFDAGVLHGSAWRAALDGLDLGSYRDLGRRR